MKLNLNWMKMLKCMGITMGICSALMLGLYFAYNQIFQAPDVTVERPAFGGIGFRPDPVVARPPDDSDAWDPDFSYALSLMPEFDEWEWDTWQRKDNFYTFLLFAIDDHRNADVIWIVSFCLENEELHIIDVPRDVRIDIADRNVRRVNAAYPINWTRDGHDEAVRVFREEIAWLIGFEVDFYVSISMRAFAQVVDILGGVTVHVPFRMVYYSPQQNLHINLFAGTQRLNGTQAVHFARWRQNTDHTGNIGTAARGRHIFQLMEAITREARSPATLARLPDLLATYNRYVNTDLDFTNLLYFANQFLRNNIQLQYHRIPVTYVTRPRWYDVPVHDETLALINATINPFTRDIEIIMPSPAEEED